MKVEIWSDVICPFCYIGKRKLEKALLQFPQRDNIELLWRSYQIAPHLKSDPSRSMHDYLAEHKGIGLQEAKKLHDYVTQLAAKVGLVYDFDKSVVANSFNAHRFMHFAKHREKQNEVEEKLFHAHFTEGKNIDDYSVLMQLGDEIGLNKNDLKKALEDGSYTNDVKTDIAEARQIGVSGVPFFVFNRKYAISGAQESEVFLQALEKSYAEWS